MANVKVRREALERDNHECQYSKLFGIAHLSGSPCSDKLEVHHITYKRYGCEDVADLITVCSRCHDLITNNVRELRYGQRDHDFDIDSIVHPEIKRTERKIPNEQDNSKTDRNRPTYNAQRVTRRSAQSLYQGDEGDYIKAA